MEKEAVRPHPQNEKSPGRLPQKNTLPRVTNKSPLSVALRNFLPVSASSLMDKRQVEPRYNPAHPMRSTGMQPPNRFLTRSLAAAMCLCFCASTLPQLVLAAQPMVFDRSAVRPGELSSDERILHALNRFTFGPRPSDMEAVKAIGLDKWFAQQLHPTSIDNSALQARLADYPAMQGSSADVLER